jgi:hypothetical protein
MPLKTTYKSEHGNYYDELNEFIETDMLKYIGTPYPEVQDCFKYAQDTILGIYENINKSKYATINQNTAIHNIFNAAIEKG